MSLHKEWRIKTMKVIDYELTCDISYLSGKRIFVYGTGIYGRKVTTVLLQMGIEIEGFCETDPKKSEFIGKRLLSPKTLIESYDESNVLVIITSAKYYNEMIDELQPSENMSLCTFYALFISLYLNCEVDGIPDFLKDNIRFYKNVSLDIAIRDLLECRLVNYYDIFSKPSLPWLYQPGKVGSVTIHESNSLKDCHLHSLAYAFNEGGKVPDMCISLIDQIKKKQVKIVTGVREPISRDISVLFQTTDFDIWPLMRWGSSTLYLFGDYTKNSKLDIQALKKRICVWEKSLNYTFGKISEEIIKNKSDEFSWFDYEIKALFDVDIYDYPFDREKGYALIQKDNISILVYKCEKLNQIENVIKDFLEEPEFKIRCANQGEQKVYSYVYKEFKKAVKLNRQYFDYYYSDNPRIRHFYTDSEIEQFKNKWEKKLL